MCFLVPKLIGPHSAQCAGDFKNGMGIGLANNATFKKFQQKIGNWWLWWDLNPGPLALETTAITTRPWKYLYNERKKITLFIFSASGHDTIRLGQIMCFFEISMSWGFRKSISCLWWPKIRKIGRQGGVVGFYLANLVHCAGTPCSM